MSDRRALYAAILAHPDDDTPRLIYADWLDEFGDADDRARAEFIRKWCEAARRDPFDSPFRRKSVWLNDDRAKAWAGWPDGLVVASRFARGFVEEVTMYSKRFVADGGKLFVAQPVRAVKFVDMTGTRGVAPPEELFACPHLARLHTVEFAGRPVNDQFAAHLARSPHLAGIRCLRIRNCALTPTGLRAVLEAGSLPNLAELGVGESSAVGSDHLAALAKSKSLARLRVLEFWDCTVGADGARALARSKHAAGLESLAIVHDPTPTGCPPLRGPGAVALAESPSLRGLKLLELRRQELRKKGGEAFAAAFAWKGLRRLSLRGNGIPVSALAAFVANPAFGALEEFDLKSNPIPAAALEPLKAAFPKTAFLTDDSHRPVPGPAPEDRP